MAVQESHEKSTRHTIKHIRLLIGVCLVIAVVVGVISLWLGQKARESAAMMETFPWINNDRCAAVVADMPPPVEEFRFAVFGDVQIGTAQLPRLFKALAAEPPVAFIVQTGDAVSHAEPGYYDLFLCTLEHSGLTVPMFVVPGNHDVRGDSTGLFERYFGPRELTFTYGNSLFILLDDSLEPFDDADYARLEEILQDNPDVQHRFVFMHVQPIHWEDDGKSPVEQNYERLFGLLDAYEVDYVFTGNWHGYHREERGPTVFVVNGRGGDFDHDERLVPCYFTMVDVNGASVTDRRVELPPKVSIVVRSYLADWLVAHLAAAEMARPSVAIGLLLSLACVSALCIVSAFRRRDD